MFTPAGTMSVVLPVGVGEGGGVVPRLFSSSKFLVSTSPASHNTPALRAGGVGTGGKHVVLYITRRRRCIMTRGLKVGTKVFAAARTFYRKVVRGFTVATFVAAIMISVIGYRGGRWRCCNGQDPVLRDRSGVLAKSFWRFDPGGS